MKGPKCRLSGQTGVISGGIGALTVDNLVFKASTQLVSGLSGTPNHISNFLGTAVTRITLIAGRLFGKTGERIDLGGGFVAEDLSGMRDEIGDIYTGVC